MKPHYGYKPGTRRAFKWVGHDDIRLHRAPKGWEVVEAALLDAHPFTGEPLPKSRWWIIEERSDADNA